MDPKRQELLNQVKFDDIVHVQYNEDTLEKNFKAIVELLKGLQNGQDRFDKDNQDNNKIIKELKESNDKLVKDNSLMGQYIQNLKQENSDQKNEIQKLKEKQEQQDKQHQQLKDQYQKDKDRILQNEKDIEELQINIKTLFSTRKELQSQFNDLQNEISDIKQSLQQLRYAIPTSNDGTGIDSNAMQNLLNEIDQLRNQFVKKEDFSKKCNEYDGRIENLEDKVEALKKLLNQLRYDFSDLKQLADNLSNNVNNSNNKNINNQGCIDPQELQELRDMIRKRVDIEKFDREINNLRNLINQLSNIGDGKNVQIISGFGEEEKKLLDNLSLQMEDLKEELRRVKKDVENHKQDYCQNKQVTDNRISNLENQIKIKASDSDLQSLKDSVKLVEDILNETTNLANENRDKIRKIKSMNLNVDGNNYQNNNNIEIEGVSEELVDEKINKCRQELLNLLTALKEEKVSFDDLWKSEAVILEKLDEVAGALLKKLADKGDTKKALIYLEKKINQLYMMLTKGQGGQQDGDGLLIKRPLFWSCMSCDKELDKLQGKVGEYKNWAVFPPKETTPERMGRFGKGYKQLLEKSRQKEERMRMEHSQILQQQTESQLPSLNKTPGVKPPSAGSYTENIM